MSKARLHIFGIVQGVCYRQFAQEMAKSLKLNGWVKNLSDGSVLVEAEGTEDSMRTFISWCKQGPRRARVETVDVEWLAQDSQPDKRQAEEFSAFRIIG